MKRLFRRAFNIFAAVSALLFVGVCVLWVRGYSVAGEQVRWRAGAGSSWFATEAGGGVMVLHADGDATAARDPALTWIHIPGYPHPPSGGLSISGGLLGFAWGSGMLNFPDVPYRVVVVPLWAVAAALAVIPAAWAPGAYKRRVRARRRRLGLCLRCGYDLTGNTSGVCSECGEAVQAEGRVAA